MKSIKEIVEEVVGFSSTDFDDCDAWDIGDYTFKVETMEFSERHGVSVDGSLKDVEVLVGLGEEEAGVLTRLGHRPCLPWRLRRSRCLGCRAIPRRPWR